MNQTWNIIIMFHVSCIRPLKIYLWKKIYSPHFVPFVFRFQGFASEPLRLAVAGVTHGISTWFWVIFTVETLRLWVFYEENTAYAYELPKNSVWQKPDLLGLAQMLDKTKPEAVAAFVRFTITSSRGRQPPRGVHVMVEKTAGRFSRPC